MILDNLRQALKIAEQVECHVAAEQIKHKWYFAIIGISESSAENQVQNTNKGNRVNYGPKYAKYVFDVFAPEVTYCQRPDSLPLALYFGQKQYDCSHKR